MAFHGNLAARIGAHLSQRTGVTERKMFGGIIFIVRLGPEEASGALAEPHTRVFDLTGRPMKASAAEGQAQRREVRLAV